MREHTSELADRAAGGAEVPPELVNGLFRSAHSLKGLAGLFGFEPIRGLAHRLEDLLDGLRLGRVEPERATVERVERAIKLFAELLVRVGDAEALAALAGPVMQLAGELGGEHGGPELQRSSALPDAAPAPAQGSADPLAQLDLDPSVLAALTEYEEHRLRESLRRGRHVLL